jgi:transcriptional regulator with XRE-family HTH domain
MDWIPAKLRRIRQELGFTQLKAAEVSGLSQRDVSQLETGRKEGLPKEYIQFLHKQGVSLNWLFTDPAQETSGSGPFEAAPKQYSAPEDDLAGIIAQESGAPTYGRPAPQVVTVGADGAAVVSLVGATVAARYPQRYADPEFYQTLPVLTLSLPELGVGVFRGFQVQAADVAPSLPLHDWVLARFTAAHERVEEGGLYVVVTHTELLIRRVFSPPGNGGLQLKADGGQPEITLSRAEVVELWSVRGQLSLQAPAPPAGPTLEASLNDLLERVRRLEQGR